jgi:hypothetical protein
MTRKYKYHLCTISASLLSVEIVGFYLGKEREEKIE